MSDLTAKLTTNLIRATAQALARHTRNAEPSEDDFVVARSIAMDILAVFEPVLEERRMWRDNVGVLLGGGDPDVILCHQGAGEDDLITSLVLTMARTRSQRDAAKASI
jgi:hypothetical protein